MTEGETVEFERKKREENNERWRKERLRFEKKIAGLEKDNDHLRRSRNSM